MASVEASTPSSTHIRGSSALQTDRDQIAPIKETKPFPSLAPLTRRSII